MHTQDTLETMKTDISNFMSMRVFKLGTLGKW